MKIGLVLEGGGFRGIFVEGVTSWLIEHKIEMPYVIGVSMGAINGANYVSKQNKRNIEVIQQFIHDPRYISKRNLVTKGGLFGMDFIFNDIAHIHHPFDFQTFETNTQEFVIGAMNCITGLTTYTNKSEHSMADMMTALRASSSLPFIASRVDLNGESHLDGGITDPIPVRKAIEDGCDKVIVVLTQNKDFVKPPFKAPAISKFIYRRNPKVITALENRHQVYAQAQQYVNLLESQGKALVIRPHSPLEVSRTEKDFTKIQNAFEAGYKVAESLKTELMAFIKT